VFTLRSGQVIKYREYLDTAALRDALRPHQVVA
jgi:ketosteroid isomerase-like protein